jgi:phosphoribosylglycinamide formyltransferase 1
MMHNLAIFASGGGSNAQKIIEYFDHHPYIKVALVVTNRKSAGVIGIAEQHNITCEYISKQDFTNEDLVLALMKQCKVDFIALAGFLLMVPRFLIDAYDSKIVNIHPSLLPKYGGPGMYGHFVHEAVKASGDIESGCTIHLVNQKYDDGEILFQARCRVNHEDTSEDIARNVLKLEHLNYAPVIEKFVLGT